MQCTGYYGDCRHGQPCGRDHPTLRRRRAQAASRRVLPGLRTCGIVGLTRRRPVGGTVSPPRIGGGRRAPSAWVLLRCGRIQCGSCRKRGRGPGAVRGASAPRLPPAHEEVANVKRTMRSAVVLGVAGSIWLLAGAGGVGVSAQESGGPAADAAGAGDWPMYRRDPRRDRVFAPGPDHRRQRRRSGLGVDLPARGGGRGRARAELAGHPDRRRRGHVSPRRRPRRRPRRGDRPRDLAACPRRCAPVAPRGLLVGGRGRHGPPASSSRPDSTCARSTRPPASPSRASARGAPSTWSCPTTRCPSCTATWWWSAPTPPPAPSAASGTRGPSMRAPAPRCGSSARSRSPASPDTTPGAATVGGAGWGPTRGRSTSPWTWSAGTSICPSRPRFPATTAATGPATTCTATPSSPSTLPPARTGGTSRRFITTCGTPTPRPRPPCSTSRAAAGRFPPSG